MKYKIVSIRNTPIEWPDTIPTLTIEELNAIPDSKFHPLKRQILKDIEPLLIKAFDQQKNHPWFDKYIKSALSAFHLLYFKVALQKNSCITSIGCLGDFILPVIAHTIYNSEFRIFNIDLGTFESLNEELSSYPKLKALNFSGEFSSGKKSISNQQNQKSFIPDHSQDYIIALTGAFADIPHLKESESCEVIEEALRVIKNGGKLVLSTLGLWEGFDENRMKAYINEILAKPEWMKTRIVQIPNSSWSYDNDFTLQGNIYQVFFD